MQNKVKLVAKDEQGFALLVAVLLMVALSFLGITALRNVSLQERMAGNSYYRAIATQEAEAGLRYTRQSVDAVAQSSSSIFDPKGSVSVPGTWTGPVGSAAQSFWANASNWSSTSSPASLNASRPLTTRVTIEQYPGNNPFCPASSASAAGSGKKTCPANFFRATARATDNTTGAAAVVQDWSMYPADY